MSPVNEKYSVPGAIVLAGVIVAGAIVLTRAPIRAPQPAQPTPENVAGTPSPKVAVRAVDPAVDHIRGSPDAPVTLVEYSDTECPFCKRFHPDLQRAVDEYPGKVRWVYRHFPLDQLHRKARKEAEATECAAAQGKFWEYVDRIFAVTPSNDGLDPDQLPVVAKDVGLDVAAFEKCLKDGVYAKRVQDDLADAERAGGQGTPFTVILGPKSQTVPFSGAQPYENLKQAIDSLLAAV